VCVWIVWTVVSGGAGGPLVHLMGGILALSLFPNNSCAVWRVPAFLYSQCRCFALAAVQWWFVCPFLCVSCGSVRVSGCIIVVWYQNVTACAAVSANSHTGREFDAHCGLGSFSRRMKTAKKSKVAPVSSPFTVKSLRAGILFKT
jgi:hypothetical protein